MSLSYPSEFNLWKEIPIFKSVLSLPHLYASSHCSVASAEKTQNVIFGLLRINGHFSVITLLVDISSALLSDIPLFLKPIFPSLSGHQSFLICHLTLWATLLRFLWYDFHYPSLQCLGSWGISLSLYSFLGFSLSVCLGEITSSL